MVLSKSDFSLPSGGESIDPTSPKSFLMRVAGLVVAFTVLIYAFSFARNRGVGVMNGLMANLGLSSNPGSDTIEVFR